MKNRRIISAAFLSFLLLGGWGTLRAQKNAEATVVVGGSEMFPMKDIVSNAVNSEDHTTLVAAVKAADLVSTLQSEGPFTVFAPTNAAFNALPDGTVEGLLQPESKKKLATVLTYHVLSGKYDLKAIKSAIKKGNGKAEFETVAGQVITLSMNGPNNITVWDANGRYADIATYDVYQSNGVIHVIDTVLLPKG